MGGSVAGEQMETLTRHREPEWTSPRMVQPARGSCPGQKWALWGTGNGMRLPKARAPQALWSLWGQMGGSLAAAALGGPGSLTEARRRGSRQLCSQGLADKAAFAFLTLGFGEGDVEGLKTEGPGLGHFRGLGGWDGRVIAERGAEAWW